MGRFRRIPGRPTVYTQSTQFTIATTAPLLPDITPQLPSDPFVDVAQRALHLGYAEVRFPTKQVFP
nr:hypothetical protein [Amphritea pacifica]